MAPIPPARVTRILVAVPVRKPRAIVTQLLKTLAWQRLHVKATIDYLFAPNFPSIGTEEVGTLNELGAFPNTVVWPNLADGDGYADGQETRHWSVTGFSRLAAIKNRMLQYAMDGKYDFVWLLDADVMCDPGTLQSMLDTVDHEAWVQNNSIGLPITAGVYWTRWQRPVPGGRQPVHAGPQVWLVHPYGLHGRGWTEQEFRAALVERRRVRVWGLGACTLVPVHAIRKGVSFAQHAGLPAGPMSEGEDRHFCAHATDKHVPLFADAWPDIYHAYHPSEYSQLADKVAALEYVPVDRPTVGTLVSAKLELLEPVREPNSDRWFRPSPRYLRGVLGTLPTLPQVEEALSMLACGTSTLEKLQFPAHWPHGSLRLQSRIARITLLDAKPFRVPPVIDEELFVGGGSLRTIDTTTLTADQLGALHADVHQH